MGPGTVGYRRVTTQESDLSFPSALKRAAGEEELADVADALGDAYAAIQRARARVPTAGVTPPPPKAAAP